MDSNKKGQLNTLLSWGTGVGIAFLLVGDTTWSTWVGWGFIIVFAGSMLWFAIQDRKKKDYKK
ncbi:hypothetical protein [Pseudalkalibacillus decolorationis]|uniref:hypothetical protein n=1 Tax=Pseudalkalibacillus decolorationis TaxID=163879 RepID=UPI002147E44D|nr:hypothetical protein [Pseudalkalibacillus decolorationis]